jgi:hypothetical protein
MVERSQEGRTMRDFTQKTHGKLNGRFIWIKGTTVIPAEGDNSMANGTRGYVVDDNGTGRIWTHAQVLAAAS